MSLYDSQLRTHSGFSLRRVKHLQTTYVAFSILCDLPQPIDYKYLSWVYGVDRKICHEGHWSASDHTPMMDTFSCIPFDLPHLIFKILAIKKHFFYSSLNKSTLSATAIRIFTLTSYLHKVTSFVDVTAVKTNVTWRRIYVTSYTTNALNTRDFYPVLGEITWVR